MEKDIIFENENGSWQTRSTQKWEQRKPYKPINVKEITAAIPGKVVRIFAAAEVGREVKKGTPLLEVEAMKMVNTIASPIDGRIKEVRVESGKDVGKNELLISFE